MGQVGKGDQDRFLKEVGSDHFGEVSTLRPGPSISLAPGRAVGPVNAWKTPNREARRDTITLPWTLAAWEPGKRVGAGLGGNQDPGGEEAEGGGGAGSQLGPAGVLGCSRSHIRL